MDTRALNSYQQTTGIYLSCGLIFGLFLNTITDNVCGFCHKDTHYGIRAHINKSLYCNTNKWYLFRNFFNEFIVLVYLLSSLTSGKTILAILALPPFGSIYVLMYSIKFMLGQAKMIEWAILLSHCRPTSKNT